MCDGQDFAPASPNRISSKRVAQGVYTIQEITRNSRNQPNEFTLFGGGVERNGALADARASVWR
jgi:hypothetical protein